MRRDDALTILKAQGDALRGHGVRSLSLFGSTARDEAGADSDVDLLVELAGAATFDRFMDVKLHLEEALGCRVDRRPPRRCGRGSGRASSGRRSLSRDVRLYLEDGLVPCTRFVWAGGEQGGAIASSPRTLLGHLGLRSAEHHAAPSCGGAATDAVA
jgi:uncharacterized protein